MKKERTMPVIKSAIMLMDLERLTFSYIQQWNKEIKPLLAACGFCDDENIRYYLNSLSTEDIFKDLCKIDDARLRFMVDYSTFKGENFWDLFRDPDCKVNSPYDKGFVFRPMPLAYEGLRDKVLKAIYVKDCNLYSSEQIISEECIVKPDQQKCELYEMVAEFCEKLKATYPQQKNVHALFGKDRAGNIIPNAEGIVFGHNGLH